MHPIVAHEIALARIAQFHDEADADRRLNEARKADQPSVEIASTVLLPDPTRLVRRLLARLRPAFAP